MKRKLILLLSVLVMFATLSACSKDEVLNRYDKVVSRAGELQLTKERSLVGDKKRGKDDYTGEYLAEYEDYTGKEYIFGGTTIDRKAGKEIAVNCNLEIETGSAKLMFISGSNEPEILLENRGEWEETIAVPEGGNYLYIEAENFFGKIDLLVE